MRAIKYLLATLLLTCVELVANAQSWRENIDVSWRFIEKDVPGAESVSYNDKSWTIIDLPHDWDIYHAPQADAPMSNDGGCR